MHMLRKSSLDQYKLGSNNKESIGAEEQVFCLFHGVQKGRDWDVELGLIQDELETDDWYNQPTTIIKKLKNREWELRKAKSIASDALLYTTPATTSSKKISAKGNSDTKNDNERPVCTHCEKKGHVETCREKHGKPKRKKDKRKGKSNRSEKSDKATANVAASFGDQRWMSTTAQRYRCATSISIVHGMRMYATAGMFSGRFSHTRKALARSTVLRVLKSDKSAKDIGTTRLPMRLPGGNVTHAVAQNVLYIPVSVNLISQGNIMDRGIPGQPLFSGRRKDCNCAADPSDASIRYRLTLYASFVRAGLCCVH
jgi:hypothetical protein